MTTAAGTGSSLRERRRADLLAEVKRVARSHLVAEGAAALSLRAVARDVGIAVSALYRYYAGRDDLLTELILDAFTAQADAVDGAVDEKLRAHPEDPVAALRAGFVAYRRWGQQNPAEFGLCYGTPVPGYAAPPERTVAAATRTGDRFVELFTRAARSGLLDPSVVAGREADLDPYTADQLSALRRRRGYGATVPELALAMDAYVRVHGFTVMDVFGQLRPVAADADGLFDQTVDYTLRGAGLLTSAPRAADPGPAPRQPSRPV